MKYAHLEENTNKLLGWYDDSIHQEIPTPNIEVTEEVWQEAININANCYEDGKFIVKDFRTNKEIAEQELNKRKQIANQYLRDTDWVDSYKIRHDLGLELIPEDSSKWIVINKREEYIVFLKAIEGAK